jgi:GNAT superfamily N-acetyltransferase
VRVDFLDYQISDDVAEIDFATVHGWLTSSYWAQGISLEKVQQAARYSALVVSARHRSSISTAQVGYCRVVSDRTRFAWLADVFVDPAHRNRGLARAIVRFALEHPNLADVPNWILGTKDAHGVYAPLGFAAPKHPERIMQFWRNA